MAAETAGARSRQTTPSRLTLELIVLPSPPSCASTSTARLELNVVHTTSGYEIYELGAEGKRRLRDDIVLPADLPEGDIEQALDDLLHELGGFGRVVRRADGRAAPSSA